MIYKIVGCCICPFFNTFEHFKFRSDVRQKYGITSNVDKYIVCLFSCCGLIQEYTQMKSHPSYFRKPVFRKDSWYHNLNSVMKDPYIGCLYMLRIIISIYKLINISILYIHIYSILLFYIYYKKVFMVIIN